MDSLKIGQGLEATQDLSAGSLTLSMSGHARDRFVNAVAIHFSAVVTQTVLLKLVSPSGVNFTFLVDTGTLTANDDYIFRPQKPFLLPVNWVLTLTCTNSGTPAINAFAAMMFQER